MKNENEFESVEEKDFLKSLDALENLAKGTIGDALDEVPETIEEIDDELNKALDGQPDVVTEEDFQKSDSGDDDDDDNGEDDDDEDTEKSFAEKAAEGSENIEKAIEVSDFLADLVDQVGFAIDSMQQSVNDRMDAMEKSLANVTAFNGELAKSLKTSFMEMDSGLDILKKSVEGMGDAPVHGRKSVTTLSKSFAGGDDNSSGKAPGRKDIIKALDTALEKSVEGVNPMDIVRFETTGTLSKSAAEAIGMIGLAE